MPNSSESFTPDAFDPRSNAEHTVVRGEVVEDIPARLGDAPGVSTPERKRGSFTDDAVAYFESQQYPIDEIVTVLREEAREAKLYVSPKRGGITFKERRQRAKQLAARYFDTHLEPLDGGGLTKKQHQARSEQRKDFCNHAAQLIIISKDQYKNIIAGPDKQQPDDEPTDAVPLSIFENNAETTVEQREPITPWLQSWRTKLGAKVLQSIDTISSKLPGSTTESQQPAKSPSVQQKLEIDPALDAYKERDLLVENVNTLTSKYAELVARRSGRMIEGAKTRRDIIATQAELSDVIGAVATELMDELESDGNDWQEVVRQIDEFIVDQTDTVLKQMEERRLDAYNNARPLMKAFYDKWAQWGNEKGLITKGKMKKVAVFAVPGAAAGAILMPVAGAIGVGAGAFGLAAMGGRSIARRLAGAKLDSIAKVKDVASEQRIDIKHRIETANATPVAATDAPEENDAGKNIEFIDIISARSEAYRKRNLRRTAGGIAIAMTAGLVSGTVADALDGRFDNIWTRDSAEVPLRPGDEPTIAGPDIVDAEPTQPYQVIPGVEIEKDTGGGPDVPGGSTEPTLTPRESLFDGRLGGRELTPAGRDAFADQFNGYEVKSGDTVWGLSEKFLQDQGVENPTVYEIDATKDAMLRELRATDSVDSRGWLSVGDKIRIK